MEGKEWSRSVATLICLLFVLSACNVDEGSVAVGAGNENSDTEQEDAGDLDVGEPDAEEPAPSCDDGVQNGDETGEDCGGDCAPCALGVGCNEAEDCESGFCTGDVCVDPSCADVQCDDEEVCYRAACYLACDDADGCDPNSRCFQGACLPMDCSSVQCASDETCYRGVCYGACSSDESCSEEGAQCIDGSCVVPTCDDGLQNGDESDADCGGDTCEGCEPGKMCEQSEDCQEPLTSDWSDCDFDGNTCARVGTQSRTVTSFSCGEALTCERSEEVETRECTRETTDQECGEREVGDWSACRGVDDSGVCSNEGERRRVITRYACADSGCEAVEDVEVESCEFDPSGQACGSPEAGAWSACGEFDSGCDEEGLRSRTVVSFVCDGLDCVDRVENEVESCPRETEGDSCGPGAISGWSSCRIPTDSCSGTQTRSRVDAICVEGGCEGVESTESRDCYADEGVSCLGPIPVDTRECVGGTWVVTTWASQCNASGSCEAVSSSYNDGPCRIIACRDDRDCGIGSCCNSGSCGPCPVQVCQPGFGCTTTGGESGCCNTEGTQCLEDAPCVG